MDYGLFNSKGLIANPDYLDYHSPQNELLNNDDADGDPNQRAQSPVEAGEPEIKRVFHPHSKRPPQFQFFQDFVRRPKRAEPTDSQPWRPFRSQLDFEVAEFCETNMLNKDSTQTLISLIHRCNATPEDFTLASQRELDELWELASHKCTEVSFFKRRTEFNLHVLEYLSSREVPSQSNTKTRTKLTIPILGHSGTGLEALFKIVA
jgi:hypothetical protein